MNNTHTIITPSEMAAIYEVDEMAGKGFTVSTVNTPYRLNHTHLCIEMEFDINTAKERRDALEAAIEAYEASGKVPTKSEPIEKKLTPAERMAVARAARGKDK